MTNQERIQSHNTRLEAIKETVANLPDAGSGGDAAEICTVNIIADAPVQNTTVTYFDHNYNYVTETWSAIDIMGGITVRCPRYSFIYASPGIFTNFSGDVSVPVFGAASGQLLVIKGDGDFTIMG